MWIASLVLAASAPDGLLQALAPPPISAAQAIARCGQGEDGAQKKFNELMEKVQAEVQRKAEAFSEKIQKNPSLAAQVPPREEAQAMSPAAKEMEVLQSIQLAMDQLEAVIASLSDARPKAADDAREKSGCKEGNDACIQKLPGLIRAAQVVVIDAKGKELAAAWKRTLEQLDQYRKVIAPRQAVLAKGKAANSQVMADSLETSVVAVIEKLGQKSTNACTAMQPLEL